MEHEVQVPKMTPRNRLKYTYTKKRLYCHTVPSKKQLPGEGKVIM